MKPDLSSDVRYLDMIFENRVLRVIFGPQREEVPLPSGRAV
jgi:hypothetical protein